MDIMSKIEEELRRKAVKEFSYAITAALEPLRVVVGENAIDIFSRVPSDIDADINALRDRIISKMSQRVQDEAVRRGGELLLKAISKKT